MYIRIYIDILNSPFYRLSRSSSCHISQLCPGQWSESSYHFSVEYECVYGPPDHHSQLQLVPGMDLGRIDCGLAPADQHTISDEAYNVLTQIILPRMLYNLQ